VIEFWVMAIAWNRTLGKQQCKSSLLCLISTSLTLDRAWQTHTSTHVSAARIPTTRVPASRVH